MEFEEACCEMDYILDHLNPRDLDRIPMSLREIFKNNKSVFYKVNIDVTKPLYEQELKEETKAFIQIINAKYLMNLENVNTIEELLKLDTMGKYENINEIIETVNMENNISKELIKYNENKIISFIKKILSKFKKSSK